MKRADFQKLAKLRLEEAKILLANGKAQGAYYLAGYAVECALKSCLAKQMQKYEFPPRNTNAYYSHDLDKLAETAKIDLKAEFRNKPILETNWQIVVLWNEQARYAPQIPPSDARKLISAIDDPQEGVMQWLQSLW